MARRTLDNELLFYVFSHLVDHLGALRACSLVSRMWSKCSQRVLQRVRSAMDPVTLKIQPLHPDDHPIFKLIGNPKGPVPHLVRQLHFDGPMSVLDKSQYTTIGDVMVRAAKLLKGLQSLSFQSIDWRSIPNPAKEELGRQCQDVTSLKLNHVFFDNPNDIPSFASYFPSLRSLKIDVDTRILKPDSSLDLALKLPDITTLDIPFIPGMEPIVKMLMNAPCRLTSITVIAEKLANLSTIGGLVTHAGSTLLDLVLVIAGPACRAQRKDSDFTLPISLSNNTKLQSLTVANLFLNKFRGGSIWLISLLQSISSTELTTFGLEIHSAEETGEFHFESDFDWGALNDQMFSFPGYRDKQLPPIVKLGLYPRGSGMETAAQKRREEQGLSDVIREDLLPDVDYCDALHISYEWLDLGFGF